MFSLYSQTSRFLSLGLPVCFGLALCLIPHVPVIQDDSSTPRAADSSLQLRGNPAPVVRGLQMSENLVAPALPEKPAVPPQISPAMMDEINAIRDQLGGGIGEQLKGMFDDEQVLRNEFEQQLLNQGKLGLPTAEQFKNVATSPRNSTFPMPRVARLRSVARQLDQAAADLEELEMYSDADRIREQAQRYRQMARQQ